MKQDTKAAETDPQRARLLPTLCFLLLALLLVFLAVRLVGSVVRRELSEPQQPADAPAPSPGGEDAAIAGPVYEQIASSETSVVHTPAVPPAESFRPPFDADPAGSAAATPAPGGAQAGAQQKPVLVGTRFAKDAIDLVFWGVDETGLTDCVIVAAIRNGACTMLFLPNNTLTACGVPLRSVTNAARLLSGVSELVPAQYAHYVRVELKGLADCVDAMGGVTVDGQTVTGTQARKMLQQNGSDELIRILAQQKLIGAFIARLDDVGLLRFAALKAALQNCTGGSLTAAQYLQLYQAVRRVPEAAFSYRILPVDSLIQDGVRYYRADAALTAALVAELYQS